MDAWYGPAKDAPVGYGGGTYDPAYPWRGVLHSTEGTTYAGALAAYKGGRIAPHFTVTFEGERFTCYQHLPIDKSGYALANRAGSVETNRARAVQIEVVGTCNPANTKWPEWLRSDRWPKPYLDGLRDLMRWVERQTGIQRVTWPFGPYPASYGPWSGRMKPEAWRTFNGWCGHQHVPENSHGDPGRIDIGYLLAAPLVIDPPKPPPPPIIEDEMLFAFRVVTDTLEGERVSKGAGKGHRYLAVPALGFSLWLATDPQAEAYIRAGVADLGDTGDDHLLTFPPLDGPHYDGGRYHDLRMQRAARLT